MLGDWLRSALVSRHRAPLQLGTGQSRGAGTNRDGRT